MYIIWQFLTVLAFRIGQEEQSSTVLAFLILGRSQSFSAT